MQLSAWKIGTEIAGAVLVACSLSLAGCWASKGDQMLTKEQAVAVATQEFVKHGRSASDYNITIEPYHADSTMVWFDRKGPFPVPGGKHGVLVNQTTGHAVFLPGE